MMMFHGFWISCLSFFLFLGNNTVKKHLDWHTQDLLEKIAPTWMNVSLKMKNDPETDNTFGWVLEMWAHLRSIHFMVWVENCKLSLASFLTFLLFTAKQKVCICCGLCSSWGAAYSTERLHVAGFVSEPESYHMYYSHFFSLL